jgi:hypothetical protein
MVYTFLVISEMLLRYGPLYLKNSEHVNFYLKLYFQLTVSPLRVLLPFSTHLTRLHGVTKITFLLYGRENYVNT